MSLKQSHFHVEPVFMFRGDTVDPYFGQPEEYVERIVDWVKGCPQPQTYGCYTLFKLLHQKRRIDVLEIMVEATMETVTDRIAELRVDHDAQKQELIDRLERQEAQVQGLLGLVKAQERMIDNLREKITTQEKSIETIREQISAQVTATVVTECAICGKFCDGCLIPRRPFISMRTY
jgi:hypothetical protein